MMPSFLLRHLLESTLFCILLIPLACCLRGAAARHAVCLMAVLKFAVPSVLLTAAGAHIASLWPAGSWLLSAAARISALLIAVLGALPLSAASGGILVIWMLGTAAMFGVWFARLRKIGSPLAPAAEEEHEALVRASRLLRVGGPVPLRSSRTTAEPALLGIWRPVITVPKGLYQQLTSSEFEAVLLHELAHVRRGDNLTGALVHGLVCVLWFHPLLWLLEKRLRIERERACDELVIACGVTPQVYISGILKVCKFHLFDSLAGVSAMAGSDLKRRLTLIHACSPFRPVTYIPRLLTAVAAVLMVTIPIAGGYCEQCISNDGAVSKEIQKR